MICSTAAIDCSARWNYARNTGKDLDFYVYLMRKSIDSDNRRYKLFEAADAETVKVWLKKL
jgi:hypothetical protein